MLYSDYLPELSRHVGEKAEQESVSWAELLDMDLPSFRPAFLVLCRVLLNVIHECLKLRLEQRPAGEPSLLSIKQVSLTQSCSLSLIRKHTQTRHGSTDTLVFIKTLMQITKTLRLGSVIYL